MNAPIDIAHTIQLAVAPVFLLAGIGALMNVVTARLGRVVDRARALEERLKEPKDETDERRVRDELRSLDRRMALAQRAITLNTVAALLVCVLVAALFLSDLTKLNASAITAILFVAAMGVLIAGLGFFLAEIRIATRTLRVRAELIMKD